MTKGQGISKMSTKYSYYHPVLGTRWPESVFEEFGQYLSKYGTAKLVAGSEAEQYFRSYLELNSLPYERWQATTFSRRELREHPFHFLSIGCDKDYDKGEYWDSNGRPCKVHSLCGIHQARRLVIDPSRSKKLDIMEECGVLPGITIISRRLKEILDREGFTGYETDPCLRVGQKYSSEELVLWGKENLARLVDEAEFFQLLVTGVAPGPTEAGELKIQAECDVCGERRYHGGGPLKYHRGSLDPSLDFQQFTRIRTRNLGVIELPGQIVITYSVLETFFAEKIKGLMPFVTDPLIRYGVVEFEE